MLNQLIILTLNVFLLMKFILFHFSQNFYWHYFVYSLYLNLHFNPLKELKFKNKPSHNFLEPSLDKFLKYFFKKDQSLFSLGLFQKTWHFYVFKWSHFTPFIIYRSIPLKLQVINSFRKSNFLSRVDLIKLLLKFTSYCL